jgi:hypothetical protein
METVLPSPDSYYHQSCIHMMIPRQAAINTTETYKQTPNIPHTVSPQITGTMYPSRLPSQPETEERERVVSSMTIKTELPQRSSPPTSCGQLPDDANIRKGVKGIYVKNVTHICP